MIGPWIVVRAPTVPTGGPIAAEAREAEVRRAAEAREAAGSALEGLAAGISAGGHPDEAAIFSAQAAMARDPALAAMTESRIREDLLDAVGATLGAAEDLAGQLRSLDDELLAARADDVLDVGRRVARLIAGVPEPTGQHLDSPAIVVAHDLAPSAAATLPRDRLLGIALETGSPTAHAAILARAYGIPAVVGVAGLLDAVEASGARRPVGSSDRGGAATTSDGGGAVGSSDPGLLGGSLAIDGDRGLVVVDPDAGERADLETRAAAAREAADRDVAEAAQPARTADGLDVTLLANIGTPEEAARCVALGAQGVGLFRTEFLFLERAVPPSEEEQLDAYRRVVEAFRPHPVTIRLLDVGGDKPIPYLPIAAEANPFLGVRALRLAATDPGIFVTQLRAAYRAAVAGPVKVMAPMIADATDADTLLGLAREARESLDRDGLAWAPVDLGVMLEIPSAVLVADSYFRRLAFASLGTNDLLQYTVAVDRGNPALGRYQDSLHPALLRLVAEAVAAAARSGVELSVCGEMGGDPVAALALVGLGVTKLSMAAGSLPRVRRAVIGSDAEVLRTVAREALDLASAADVRTRFESLAAGRGGEPTSG